MNVKIKGGNIVLSEAPIRDVDGAFLVLSAKTKKGEIMIDAKNGQKEYKLPEGLLAKDIDAVYLRIL